MSEHNIEDFTFEALCGNNAGPEIDTLAYAVGLVDRQTHAVQSPDFARYDILYQLEHGTHFDTPEDLLGWQSEILPAGYLPQTPLMFARRWSPIGAMLTSGYRPIMLARETEGGPHAIASGIWQPENLETQKPIPRCTTDKDLFWSIMSAVFKRGRDRRLFVSIIAEVGWSYDSQIGSLVQWDDCQIATSGRVLWKCTPHDS